MLVDRPLVIVTGKGGAGRSAVAAALARRAARAGARVLALAIGAPDGLEAHLGSDPLASVPCDASGGVAAARVDPGSALDEYVRLRVGLVPLRVAGRMFSSLAIAVPGIRDIVVMGKCIHEATSDQWDVVVVDGYPTGQVESVLGAPAAVAELIERGPVHDQAAGLRSSLADADVTALVVVATPEELALTEAVEFSATARDLGLPSPALVVNHCIAAPGYHKPPAELGPLRDVALFSLGLVARQRELLATVTPTAILPHLFGSTRPEAVTAALSEALS